MIAPKTYDEWLALSPEQQGEVHFSIRNVYEGDGLAIAHMAAVRLAMSCPYKIHQIATGIYRGGEHLLHLTVADEDYPHCPAMLAQSFEGFRVVWLSKTQEQPPAWTVTQITGAWLAEDDPYGVCFQFLEESGTVVVRGCIPARGEQLQISDVAVLGNYLVFSARGEASGYQVTHCFQMVGPDQCNDQNTAMKVWRKVADSEFHEA